MIKRIIGVVIIFILIAALAAGGYYYYMRQQIMAKYAALSSQQFAIPVESYTVVPSNYHRRIEAIGTLRSNDSVAIKAEISGLIEAINFTEGAEVKKGEVLVQLDDDTYRAELAQKIAIMDLAKVNYNRMTELLKRGAGAMQARDEALSKWKEANANLDLAQVRLDKTKITAPFTGIVGFREVSVGDYVAPGETITRLVAMNPLMVEFNIPEVNFADVKRGQLISVTVDAYENKVFKGQVIAIDPNIDPETRNIRIKGEVPNPDLLLRPGMFAYVDINLGEKKDAIMVPEEAIIPKGSEYFVYKIVDKRAVLTQVLIGVRQKAMAEIKSGLKTGDVVITTGHMKVHEGSEVKFITDKKSEDTDPASTKDKASP